MKHSLFTFMLTCFLVWSAQAQYWQVPNPNAGTNPGGLNTDNEYPVGSGLSTTWTSFLTASTSPVWSTVQTIPFSFSFNGSPVTDFKVSNSGILTFDVATALPAPAFTPVALPNANIPDNSVCISGLGGPGANDIVVRKTFGTAPNRQLWIFFTSYGYGTVASDGSNFTYWSMVLEETTNRIHIVDQRTGGYSGADLISAGIQINSTTAFSVAGSPALNSLAGTSPAPDDNSYYTFVPGTQPAFDMSVLAITSSAYLPVGNTTFSGDIKNLGSTTISSFDINYKIDNGAVVTATISGVNIAPLATYNFTHATPWLAVVGTHSVEMYASNLNGANADANPFDDASTKTVYVMNELVQRLPLFEIYTSSTCGPCAPGNTNYHSIVDTKPASDFVSVKFQQDFPSTGDPYATDESVNRRSAFYAITSIPRMMIDGGWNSNASSFTNALYDEARLVAAQYKLTGTYAISNKTVSGKVHFSPVFNATGAKLHIAIMERLTTANVKTNGETEFHHVMKKMVPNQNGSNVPSLAIGAWDSLSYSYTFNGDYRLPDDGQSANRINHATEHSVEEFSDLYVVAWIQGADKTVYQAANLLQATGLNNIVAPFGDIQVYPNPANNYFEVKCNAELTSGVSVSLADEAGNVIETRRINRLNANGNIRFLTESLSAGIYNLMIVDDKGNVDVRSVVVSH